jgi:hypothetical protein
MINDRALGFSRMGKGPSSLFSIRSRLSSITAVAFAVCNISSWIYRETASIFAVEHNALFELSLKCCAHDSLARPGNLYMFVCLALALPRARSHATEAFPRRSSLFIQIRPRKGLLGLGERGFAPIKCTLILSPCCSFLSVFFIV